MIPALFADMIKMAMVMERSPKVGALSAIQDPLTGCQVPENATADVRARKRAKP